MGRSFGIYAAFLLAFAPLSAIKAQETVTQGSLKGLEAQIYQLQQQLQSLQAQVSEGAAFPAPSNQPSNGGSDLTAQLLQRVTTLEGQMRDLRGQIDQANNQMQTATAALNKQVADLSFKLDQKTPSHASRATSAKNAGDIFEEKSDFSSLLTRGQQALKVRQYSSAQHAGEQALRLAKTSSRKGEAQFLIAQSLAGQKRFNEAAKVYYSAYLKSRHNLRGQEALLGVSAAMLAAGNTKIACQALGQLHRETPNLQGSVARAVNSLQKRANCHE